MLTLSNKTDIRTPPFIPPFIVKTFTVLEEKTFPEIIDWNAEGTALVIKKPIDFSQKVLPKYCKHGNLTSFVRLLNMYDFHKRRSEKYDHVYYHSLFQRNKKHLLPEIKRKNQDSTLIPINKGVEVDEDLPPENHLIEIFDKDSLSRISALEDIVKELTLQNQNLFEEVTLQRKKEGILISFLASFSEKKDITLDDISKVINNDFDKRSLSEDSEIQGILKDLGLVGPEDNVANYTFDVDQFFNFDKKLNNPTDLNLKNNGKEYLSPSKANSEATRFEGQNLLIKRGLSTDSIDLYDPQKTEKRKNPYNEIWNINFSNLDYSMLHNRNQELFDLKPNRTENSTGMFLNKKN